MEQIKTPLEIAAYAGYPDYEKSEGIVRQWIDKWADKFIEGANWQKEQDKDMLLALQLAEEAMIDGEAEMAKKGRPRYIQRLNIIRDAINKYLNKDNGI